MIFNVIGNAIAIVNAPPIIIQNQNGMVSFGLVGVVLGVGHNGIESFPCCKFA